MTIGVLALQGAFIEHEKMLRQLGAECVELRQKADLSRSFDGLIIPGGESTVQGKLLRELDMFDTIRTEILHGMPVFGTCAGLILLADQIENDSSVHLATMQIRAKRNAYGRQLGSFYTEEMFEGIGTIPMTFIRAPYIVSAGPDVKILAEVQGKIIAAQQKNQLVTAFHPELNQDLRVHQYFLSMISDS